MICLIIDQPGSSNAAIDDPLAAEPGLPCGKRRILVVDDDDSVRETLAELLDLEGYFALQAADAGGALAILGRENVDLLITDLSMPGADGIALIKEAKALQEHLPVILLTGYAEEATTVSAIFGARFHVLRKPVHGRHLLQQLELLLNEATKA